MNYYQFHIGDFNNATRYLTKSARHIYRDLLDIYYDTESPLPLDLEKLSRIAMITKKDRTNLEIVLADFFTKTEDGYRNKRCDEEIKDYREKAEIARQNGKNGGRPPSRNNPSGTKPVSFANQMETGLKANHKPLTINQEPITKVESMPKGTPPDFLEALKTNPAYAHVDFERELGKMDAWLSLPKNKHRKKTKAFVLNWINKIDAPIGSAPKAENISQEVLKARQAARAIQARYAETQKR